MLRIALIYEKSKKEKILSPFFFLDTRQMCSAHLRRDRGIEANPKTFGTRLYLFLYLRSFALMQKNQKIKASEK
jgi:hypothetical protein